MRVVRVVLVNWIIIPTLWWSIEMKKNCALLDSLMVSNTKYNFFSKIIVLKLYFCSLIFNLFSLSRAQPHRIFKVQIFTHELHNFFYLFRYFKHFESLIPCVSNISSLLFFYAELRLLCYTQPMRVTLPNLR